MFSQVKRHWLPIVMLLMLAVGWNLTYTPTGSMEPTIQPWHIYRCVRWPFAPEPERGDIILYRDGWRIYCKRLVGLPGDVVYIYTTASYRRRTACWKGLRRSLPARGM